MLVSLYVVECGNGVARQIVRAGFALKHLKSIFITQQVSGHNLDYVNLLLDVERGVERHCELLRSAACRHDDEEVLRTE
jgi:ribonuclease BN (tRNA processing enzyme)